MTSAHKGPFLAIDVDDKVDLVSSGQPPPSYQAASSEAPPPPPVHHDRCRRRFRRFGHFLVATLFLWFGARYILRHCELRSFAPPPPDDLPWGPPPHGFPPGHPPGHGGHLPRPGEHIDSCVDPSDWVEIDPSDGHIPPGFDAWQRAELFLPSSADDIFLISPGFNTGGVLHLVEAADRDDIGVEVTVGSSGSSDLFKRTKVCTLRRGEDGHGVGILTHPFKHHPRNRDHRDSLFFNITVSLPKGKDIATIPRFETHLPKFGHIIKALEKNAFGSICLHSSDSPIFVEGLVGDKIRICSRNSPIAGTFNTSSSIKIETSNSPIKVTVNAFSQDNHPATRVKIRTSNSILSANLALLSAPESQSSGSFVVHTRTSNSPLAVNFTDHTPDALLKLEAHTTNSPAHVHLHPSFEGVFKLRTTIFPALVSTADDVEVEDPAGRGRTRVINVKSVGHGSGIVFGDVAWVPQDEVASAGKVDVSTSNSPLRLSL